MLQLSSLHRVLVGGVIWAVFSACAPSSYVVKPPTPSGIKYETKAAVPKTQLSVIDARRLDDRTFSSGVLPAALVINDAPIDGYKFLAEHLGAELASRGVPVTTTTTDAGVPRLHVRTFRMQNHRVNAYSPFVTFTFLSVDLETTRGKQRYGVFIKRGKVPVWSFDELIEPTLNQPLALAVRELATKIAGTTYGYRASDATVKELVGKLATRTENSYLDVYALGFTNNPTAIEPLLKLLDDSDEYVRLAAISSLGTLRATGQVARLKSIYQGQGQWQDRAMAIKAMADIGTAETDAFIEAELKRVSTLTDKDATWTTQILALYQ